MDLDLKPEWIDVANPDTDPTTEFCSGCPERDDDFGENFATYAGSNMPVIPRDQWKVLPENESIKSFVQKIKNQGREGTCTANNTATNFEIAMVLAFGADKWMEMSPISIYKQCGRSPNSGSSVSCCMRTAREIGILPVDNSENRARLREMGLDPNHVMPATGFHTPYPAGWTETANHFRIAETYDIANFDEFASALLSGFSVSYGRSGHSICGVRLVRYNGQWAVEYANSWAPSWGNEGYGYDTESYLSGAIRQYGAIATRNIHMMDATTGNAA